MCGIVGADHPGQAREKKIFAQEDAVIVVAVGSVFSFQEMASRPAASSPTQSRNCTRQARRARSGRVGCRRRRGNSISRLTRARREGEGERPRSLAKQFPHSHLSLSLTHHTIRWAPRSSCSPASHFLATDCVRAPTHPHCIPQRRRRWMAGRMSGRKGCEPFPLSVVMKKVVTRK